MSWFGNGFGTMATYWIKMFVQRGNGHQAKVLERRHCPGDGGDTWEQAKADDGIEDGDIGFRQRQLAEEGIVRDDLGQKQRLYRSLGDNDARGIVWASEASQIRN